MPKLCVLGDTRTYHDWLRVPRAVLTVHTGNFTKSGTFEECVAFLAWFGALAGMKALVAGRNDHATKTHASDFRAECARSGIVYLEGERATIAGLRVWGGTGAPPPDRMDLDLLVTHEAPFGIGDRRRFSPPAGSHEVLDRVYALRPRAHAFCGTDYEAGRHDRPDMATVFLNAAISPLTCLLRRPLTHEIRSATPAWNEETKVTRRAAPRP